MRKIFLITATVLLVSFTLYHLMWGRLFPWSPVKIGYRQITLKGACVILPKHTPLPVEFKNMVKIFSETEEFHDLKFQTKIKIIIPATHKSYKNFSGQNAIACALQTGTVIFLSPEIKRRNRELAGILRHELSHALLFQNTTLAKSFKIPPWLREGIAVYYGNPGDYYEGIAFIKNAAGRKYMVNIRNYDKDLKAIPEKHRYKFLYAEFRYFISYIVSKYGREAFLRYIKLVLQEPGSEEKHFRKIFKKRLNVFFNEFKNDVTKRKLPESFYNQRR
jgi:hypothetical protein